jgi:hypothetical protein
MISKVPVKLIYLHHHNFVDVSKYKTALDSFKTIDFFLKETCFAGMVLKVLSKLVNANGIRYKRV